MMEKIVEVGSWPKMAEEPVQLVKISSRGLLGEDRRTLEKRASPVFVDQLSRVKLAHDELPIHVLALGATEFFGPNRNGDGFTVQTCRDHHDSFVKNARHYEHHRNTDPARSFGDVRLSAYNEPMGRVELLVIGNRTKEAARRNGGLVLPASVVDDLESGRQTGWSMACKVAADECSNCGNKAANRSEYCTEDTCFNKKTGRRMPGCKRGLGKMAEDGFLLYVDNPRPLWFDISRVHKPADRNAYGWKADYVKAAADCSVIGGAELAELYAAQNGFSLLSPDATRSERALAHRRKVAHLLANVESTLLVEGLDNRDQALSLAFTPAVTPDIPLEPLSEPGSVKFAGAIRALADTRALLSPLDFARIFAGHDKCAYLAGEIQQALPGVFNSLASDAALDNYLQDTLFTPSSALPAAATRSWAAKVAESRSADPAFLRQRTELATLLDTATPFVANAHYCKTASAGPAFGLAKQYALYKIAAISYICEESGEPSDVLLRAAVLQNLVAN